MAQQHEYLVLDLTGVGRGERMRQLDIAGKLGWELVNAGSYWAYLKRPVSGRPSPPPPPPLAKRERRES